MKKLTRLLSLLIVGLFITGAANAATVFVIDNAYRYVNTDNTTDGIGLFTNETFDDHIEEAFFFDGNISDGMGGFEANLNQYFSDADNATYGDDHFEIGSAVKTEGGGFENPFGSAVMGVLFKHGTENLVVIFDSPIDSLFWNTLFADNGTADGISGISHYVLFDPTISEVPLPAALWLFGPALLGFMGFRRKAKTVIA